MRKLRVFLSSTSSGTASTDLDLRPERDRTDSVIHRLSFDFAEQIEIEVVRWEEHYYSASSTFQDQITRPSRCDLVIFLFWKRLGSELPPAFNRRDGTSRSGTEFEFEDAVESALTTQDKVPDILVYRKTAPVLFHEETVDRERADKLALDSFWARWFQNERGHFTAAFKTFDRTDDFADLLDRDLREWIVNKCSMSFWHQGSPFPGLTAFDESHAAVFFGRRRVVELARARLVASAVSGLPFLLVLGASGSGKSSLVRAGLVPRLLAPDATPVIARFRRLVISPFTLGKDPLQGFAAALMTEDVLPELAAGDYADPDMLANLFASAPGNAPVPIKAALNRIGAAIRGREGFEHQPRCALLLVVDQFEEALSWSEALQSSFGELLYMLARSGAAWIVASFRSDLYAELQRVPVFLRLKEGGNSLDLASPTEADLREIILRPAQAAGLAFEVSQDGSRDLAQLIEAETSRPGALPMLAFALACLYEQRDPASGRLLLSAYDAMGGATGALASEGNLVLDEVDPTARLALPALVRRLVTISSSGHPIAASVDLSSFPEGTPVRRLADRLRDARLLTSFVDAEIGSSPRIRVSHEALFSHWPVLRTQIDKDRRDLETLGRAMQAMLLWRASPAAERNSRLLTGLSLSESEDLLDRWKQDLDPTLRTYIASSLAHARQHMFRVRMALAAVVALLAALAGTATLFGLRERDTARLVKEQAIIVEGERLSAQRAAAEALAEKVTAEKATNRAQQEAQSAERASHRAEDQARLAERERSTAQIAQSHYLAAITSSALQTDNSELASLLALEGAPQPGVPRPFLMDLVAPLAEAMAHDNIKTVFTPGPGPMMDWSADAKMVFGSYSGPFVTTWDLDTGMLRAAFRAADDQAGLESVRRTPEGFVTVSEDNRFVFWSSEGKKQREVPFGLSTEPFSKREIANDGRWAMLCNDRVARVLDLSSGQIVTEAVIDLSKRSGSATFQKQSCEMSDSGRWLATWISGEKEFRLVDLSEPAKARTITVDSPIFWVICSRHDGAIVVTSTSSATVLRPEDAQEIGHFPIAKSFFRPAVSSDGTRIALLNAGKIQLFSIRGELLGSWDMPTAGSFIDFSPDGSMLLAMGRERVFALDGAHLNYLGASTRPRLGRWQIAPIGRDAVISSPSGTVATDFEAPLGPKVLTGDAQPLSTVGISDDGATVMTYSWDRKIRLWDGQTGRERLQVGAGGSRILEAKLSPDGSRLLTTTSDARIRLLDTASGAEIATLPGRRAYFMHNSQRIGVISAQELEIWTIAPVRLLFSAPLSLLELPGGLDDSEDGQTILVWWLGGAADVFQMGRSTPVCQSRSPDADGPSALTAGGRDILQVTKASNVITVSVESCAVSGTTAPVRSTFGMDIALSRAGDRAVLTVPGANSIVVDSHTLKQRSELLDSDGVYTFAMSPDGGRVLGNLYDGSISLWDVETGVKLGSQPRPGVNAKNLTMPALSGDGTHVVFASSAPRQDVPGTATVWTVPTPQAVLGWSFAAQARTLTTQERAAAYLPKPSMHRLWPENPNSCDLLGADSNDPDRTAPGTDKLDAKTANAAIDACELAVRDDPEQERYRVQLARSLAFAGRWPDAMARLIDNGDPREPFGLYLLGCFLLREGKNSFERAQAYLERASAMGVAKADFTVAISIASSNPAQASEAAARLRQAAAKGDPAAEGELAEQADRRALNEKDDGARRANFAEAFSHWARQVQLMRVQDWPEQEAVFGTTRRATLARWLQRQGLSVDEVARLYWKAIGVDPSSLGIP